MLVAGGCGGQAGWLGRVRYRLGRLGFWDVATRGILMTHGSQMVQSGLGLPFTGLYAPSHLLVLCNERLSRLQTCTDRRLKEHGLRAEHNERQAQGRLG